MTKEEHAQLLESLRKAETEVDRMNIIVQLQQDYHEVLTEHAKAVQNYQLAEQEKIKYAELNNKLWLQTNASLESLKSDPTVGDESTGDEPPQKRSFEDLNFD